MTYQLERRLLQASIALAGCVPVFTGGAGMLFGLKSVDIAADSHFRYLSGLLCGIGLCFWYAIPRIEKAGSAVRMLCIPIVIGGFARLLAATFIAVPPLPMLLAIVMELVVTPAICLWQFRVSRLEKDS